MTHGIIQQPIIHRKGATATATATAPTTAATTATVPSHRNRNTEGISA